MLHSSASWSVRPHIVQQLLMVCIIPVFVTEGWACLPLVEDDPGGGRWWRDMWLQKDEGAASEVEGRPLPLRMLGEA